MNLGEAHSFVRCLSENSKVVKAVSFGGSVYGMTVLDCALYVVSGNTSKRQVDVYDCNTLEKQKSGIRIPKSGSLWSIVARRARNIDATLMSLSGRRPLNDSLYISDEARKLLYKHDLKEKSTNIKWNVPEGCLGLSLTRQGNILIVFSKYYI